MLAKLLVSQFFQLFLSMRGSSEDCKSYSIPYGTTIRDINQIDINRNPKHQPFLYIMFCSLLNVSTPPPQRVMCSCTSLNWFKFISVPLFTVSVSSTSHFSLISWLDIGKHIVILSRQLVHQGLIGLLNLLHYFLRKSSTFPMC